MSDIQTMLGKLIPEDAEVQRDAIHIAVIPVLCNGWDFQPGQPITVRERGTYFEAVPMLPSRKPVAIIDPFLPAPVKSGTSCFAFVYPNTVTGMRHHWQHPAFPDPAPADDVSYSDDSCRGCYDE